MSKFAHNTFINFLGMIIPAVVAFICLPILVRSYDEETFGLISLVINLIAAYIFLDFGMSTGATKYAAHAIRHETQSLPEIFWTNITLVLTAGIPISIAAYFLTPVAVKYMDTSPGLVPQVTWFFQISTFAIPFVTLNAVLKGVIDATQRFTISNAIKIPATSLLFVIPALGIVFHWSIIEIVWWLLASRIATTIAYGWATIHLHPAVAERFLFSKPYAKKLLRFGGWVSFSNFINPLVNQGEKFLISSLVSLSFVAYYTAPYELVSRVTVVAYAAAITLLPRISAQYNEADSDALFDSLKVLYKSVLLVYFPAMLLVLFFASEILTLYLGVPYAENSTEVMKILSIAFFFNAFGLVAVSVVNGAGRPDFKAKIDSVLVVGFGILCFLLIPSMGIAGAAVAKTTIMAVDTLLLTSFTITLARKPFGYLLTKSNITIALWCVAALGIALFVPFGLGWRIALFIVFTAVFITLYLRFWGTADIKRMLSFIPGLNVRTETV